MASSTTRPTATARPPRVMMFRVIPVDLHDHQGGQDRQRDADRRDQRRAHAEQEQEDGQDREQRAEAALAEQSVGRLLDEVGQVRDGRDDDRVRSAGRRSRRACLDRLGDEDGVRVRGLGHRQRQRRACRWCARSRSWRPRRLDRAEVADRDRRRARPAAAASARRRRRGTATRRRGCDRAAGACRRPASRSRRRGPRSASRTSSCRWSRPGSLCRRPTAGPTGTSGCWRSGRR